MSKFQNLDAPGADKKASGKSQAQEKDGAELFENNTSTPETPTTPEAQVSPAVTPAQVESLLVQELVRVLKGIDSKNDSIAEAIKQVMSTNTTEDTVLSPDAVAAQYTSDDVLDTPVMFFRPCGAKFVDMGGPAANGTYHYPPFRDRYNKPIPMIWDEGPEVFTGFGVRGERVVQKFAQYICKSKKELEYIRKHRDFGTLILENTIDIAFTTNNFINALSNASKKVAYMNQVDRIMFAKDRGIDTNQDPEKWYNELVLSLATDESRSKNIQLSQAANMFESLKNTMEHPGSRGRSAVGIAPLGEHESVLQIHRTV